MARGLGVLAALIAAVAIACSGRSIDAPGAPSAVTATSAQLETPDGDVDPDAPGEPAPSEPPAPTPELPVPPAGEAVLIGAGDIALCNALDRAQATARLIDSQLRRAGGVVITLGDNSNDDGRPEQYAECFSRTWGRFDVRPSPGNHDDYDENSGNQGAAYYQFFGGRAGPANLGYYSFTASAWHVVSLNSEIVNRGPREDAQLAWLRNDLDAHTSVRCVLAYFHRPMISSGEFAAGRMARLWQVLYAAGADVIVNGHEHFYERFQQLTPAGVPDPHFGIRQFIVGTGGAGFHASVTKARGSERLIQGRLGVLRLTLRPEEYDWEFIDVDGAVLDSGRERCHGKPS